MATDVSVQDVVTRAAARDYALNTCNLLERPNAGLGVRLSLDLPSQSILQERSPPRASFNCAARTSSHWDQDQGTNAVKRPWFLRRWLPHRRNAAPRTSLSSQHDDEKDDLFKLPNLSVIGEASGLPDFTQSMTGRKSPASMRAAKASRLSTASSIDSQPIRVSSPKTTSPPMPSRTSTITRHPSIKAQVKDPHFASWFHSRDDMQRERRERRERRNRVQISLPLVPAPDIREHPYHKAGTPAMQFTSPRSAPSPSALAVTTPPRRTFAQPQPAIYDSSAAATMTGPTRESTSLCPIKEDEASSGASTSVSTAPGKISFSTDDSRPSDPSYSTPSSRRSSYAASLHTARSRTGSTSSKSLAHAHDEEQYVSTRHDDLEHEPMYSDEQAQDSVFDLALAEEAFEADGLFPRTVHREKLLTALPERSYFDMDSDSESRHTSPKRWRSLSLRRSKIGAVPAAAAAAAAATTTTTRPSSSLRRSYSSALAATRTSTGPFRSSGAGGARLQKRRSAGAAGAEPAAASDMWGMVKARVATGGR